ncbi:hypothetical protein F4777DRAFT_550025 [Nemania sp. FL0916]|nr:hypothetical protein F4777DRAFT_550025 [Nemania sp. FL0916]
MAPTRPARAAKENGTPTKAADASEAPAKRGRGRPPKNGVAAKPKQQPSGRPRGRPPGSGGVKKATAKKATTTSTSTGRRGRPKAGTDATTPKKAATPKAAAKSKAKGSATKGRKARKSDVAEEPEEDDEEDIGAEEDEEAVAEPDQDMDDEADGDNLPDEDLGLQLEVALPTIPSAHLNPIFLFFPFQFFLLLTEASSVGLEQ